jgi:hypothetical protein
MYGALNFCLIRHTVPEAFLMSENFNLILFWPIKIFNLPMLWVLGLNSGWYFMYCICFAEKAESSEKFSRYFLKN